MRGLLKAAAGVSLVLLAGFLYEKHAGKDAYPRFNPPGRRVQVNGRNLYCLGLGERSAGQPLVVLEAGHGDWSKCWAKVHPEIARFARVLAYDRAGSGWSDPGPTPRSAERMVRELHDLLTACAEPPPYLLVGHSMGAPLSRLFSHLYPGEVSGMVWVDSAHERMDRYFSFYYSARAGTLLSLQAARVLSRLGLVRLVGKRLVLKGYPSAQGEAQQAELLAQVRRPQYFDWLYAETAGLASASSWPEENPSLGSLPVISIEAQYPDEPLVFYSRKQWREFLSGWQAIHADLSRLSTRMLRIAAQTNHQVMDEAPNIVIDAVKEMLENELG